MTLPPAENGLKKTFGSPTSGFKPEKSLDGGVAVTGKELLRQLRLLNQSCREALKEENFRKLRALMQLKQDLLFFLKKAAFEAEDLPLVQEALSEEEELANLALAKQAALEARCRQGWLH